MKTAMVLAGKHIMFIACTLHVSDVYIDHYFIVVLFKKREISMKLLISVLSGSIIFFNKPYVQLNCSGCQATGKNCASGLSTGFRFWWR